MHLQGSAVKPLSLEVLENLSNFADMLLVTISIKDAGIIEEMFVGCIGTFKKLRHTLACTQLVAYLSPLEHDFVDVC